MVIHFLLLINFILLIFVRMLVGRFKPLTFNHQNFLFNHQINFITRLYSITYITSYVLAKYVNRSSSL